MKLPLILAAAWLASSCHSTGSPEVPMAELRASQSSGYGVPAGAGDVSFTTSASMGAVVWAQLSEGELSEWQSIWSQSQGAKTCPSQRFTDGSGKSANLFQRSPKDGFCVAFAHRASGRLAHPDMAGFLDSL